MEIIYMQELQKWCSKFGLGKGVDEEKIRKNEALNELTFPKAFKEFLLLSGNDFYPTSINVEFENMFVRQSRAQELLKKYKLSHLIQKKFWVVGETEYSFFYVYLDEGDNPPVYRLTPEEYADHPDETTFGEVADSFSAWIDKAIGVWEFEQTLEDI